MTHAHTHTHTHTYTHIPTHTHTHTHTQIMMVYEMSDEPEIEMYMQLLKSDSQLPGLFLYLGLCLSYYRMCSLTIECVLLL